MAADSQSRRSGRPLEALVGLLLAAAAPLVAAEPMVAVSSSQQFSVRGMPLGHLKNLNLGGSSLLVLDPSLLAVTCENIRHALAKDLRWGDPWRGRIYVELHPLRPGQDAIVVHSTRTRDGWNYRLDMPDELPAPRLVRAVTEVLLMEYANRAAGEHAAELPPWLAPGLAAYLQAGPLSAMVLAPNRPVSRSRVNPGFFEHLRARLGTNLLLTLDQLNWPAPDQFEEGRAAQYDASAMLLVRELLRLDGGPDCLREMLDRASRHLNWQTAFLQAFAGRFRSLLDVEKWWSLVLIGTTGTHPDQILSRQHSLQRLDEILYTPVEVRMSAAETPHQSQASLQMILMEWGDEQRVRVLWHKAAQLRAVEPQLEPEVAPLAAAYRQAFERYLQDQNRMDTVPNPRSLSPSQSRTLIRSLLTEIKALDRQRERLWNPPPVVPSRDSRRPAPAPPKTDSKFSAPPGKW